MIQNIRIEETEASYDGTWQKGGMGKQTRRCTHQEVKTIEEHAQKDLQALGAARFYHFSD